MGKKKVAKKKAAKKTTKKKGDKPASAAEVKKFKESLLKIMKNSTTEEWNAVVKQLKAILNEKK